MQRSHENKKSLFFGFITIALFSLTLVSGLILSSSSTSAANNDTVVDDVSISIPMACTLSGVGMNTHNATINNGTYASDIGTTTIKALCNDNEGFAIYAIGYTDNIDGKNVLSNSTLGSDYDIATGTLTSGNSQWAMKLIAQSNPTPTYPITIENNYNNYHTVPSNYELVAKRTAATDIGSSAEGSTLTSTYQVYISENQPAGSYAGQVKYVMVHPSNTNEIPVRDDQIGVNFYVSNSLNRVVYGKGYEQIYVATSPGAVVETSNLTNGVQTGGAYADDEELLETKSLPGASKVKVVVDYGITEGDDQITIVEGTWDGDSNLHINNYNYYEIHSFEENLSGTDTYILDGDTITISFISDGTPEPGYDYGMYARLYPIYATEQANTEEETVPTLAADSGTYIEPGEGNKWWLYVGDFDFYGGGSRWRSFDNETELTDFLMKHYDSLRGTNVEISNISPSL